MPGEEKREKKGREERRNTKLCCFGGLTSAWLTGVDRRTTLNVFWKFEDEINKIKI